MQHEQTADFVLYYDAADPNWLVVLRCAIAITLVVLAVAAAVWRKIEALR